MASTRASGPRKAPAKARGTAATKTAAPKKAAAKKAAARAAGPPTTADPAALVEYPAGATFPGVIGRTFDVSSPAWPETMRTPAGTPNVLFIVLDDTGFGHLGCFGSPISTPNFDRLAANGLRYTNMHTTALCSPTRSCILTGRNHHSNHMACITEGATGYPGYDGVIPFENGFLSEILHEHGLQHVCRRQVAPRRRRTRSAQPGPYDALAARPRVRALLRVPGRRHAPVLPRARLRQPHRWSRRRRPEDGYHLTEDLVDKAISFMADSKQVAPDKPFFMYFCPGAQHAPHHVPTEWADRYKGAFDDGWDAYREQRPQGAARAGSSPRARSSRRTIPTFRTGTTCRPTSAGSTRG